MATVHQLKFNQDAWTVLVRFDRVYGKILCYPANQQAALLCAISGKRTLSPFDLKNAQKMGFEIVLTMESHALLDAFLA